MVKLRASAKRPQFQPVDLQKVPHVDALLEELNVGPFDPSTVSAALGRNNNWSGTTRGGERVFVKQLLDGESDERIRRTESAWRACDGRLSTPRLIGSDPEHALLVFAHVPDARSGVELLGDEEFDEDLCARAGRALAVLHGLDVEELDTSPHPLPPLPLLEALSLDYYRRASAAELSMWRLLQADLPLIEALGALRAADTEEVPSRCAIHGDLRLDQFLLSGDELHLTDFEEFRAGDPARDIGAFAGEWLFHAVVGIPAKLAESSSFGHVATHEEIIATGAAEIEQRAPYVRAFFSAYLEDAPGRVHDDKGLAARAAAYAGWHMLDRMLAAAGNAAHLSAVNKAAAGIGRTVLLSPADFTSSLGLEA
ncbi:MULTISPECIES: class V lanthionine synthetase subunit LxmK [unclassified Kitasatospora]|uniref:class V lanthionine synthetase subunit LxmK n=1 Tax=unclassified Kitasatospora TaxID=2633591 RepID=UPI00340BD6FC